MIRTFLVDDQNLIREGIRMLLEKAVKIEIVGDANNGESALERIEAIRPDVVLLDIDMPGIDGFTVAGKMRSRFPQIKIIMLSSHEDKTYVEKSIALGAKGYLLKDATAEELERSIELVYQGYSTIKSDLLGENTVKEERLELHSGVAPKIASPAENARVSLAFNSAQSPSSVASTTKSNDLELLLAKNQVRRKYESFSKQRQQTQLFHSTSLTQLKRTVSSFEFRLLILIILFSLGFLTFVALS